MLVDKRNVEPHELLDLPPHVGFIVHFYEEAPLGQRHHAFKIVDWPILKMEAGRFARAVWKAEPSADCVYPLSAKVDTADMLRHFSEHGTIVDLPQVLLLIVLR